MIQATELKNQPYDSYAGHLINWVQYHETISRFTIHHWRHKSLVPTTPVGNCPTTRNIHTPSLTRYRPVCNFPRLDCWLLYTNYFRSENDICESYIRNNEPPF